MDKSITVRFPSDKLKALELFLRRKDTTLEKEMLHVTQQLYEKTVPASVREYVDTIAGRTGGDTDE